LAADAVDDVSMVPTEVKVEVEEEEEDNGRGCDKRAALMEENDIRAWKEALEGHWLKRKKRVFASRSDYLFCLFLFLRLYLIGFAVCLIRSSAQSMYGSIKSSLLS
jgi:hypothetical protein